MNTFGCDNDKCDYYSFSKHSFDIQCSRAYKHYKKNRAIGWIGRQKQKYEGDRREWAHSDKRLKLDRLTASSAAHLLKQKSAEKRARDKADWKKNVTNDKKFNATAPKVEETGQNLYITISDSNEDLDAIKISNANATGSLVHGNLFDSQPKDNQTVSFEKLFPGIKDVINCYLRKSATTFTFF